MYSDNKQDIESLENELRILQKISLKEYKHPNVMQAKELYKWTEETDIGEI